jgi:hypothetical protein
MWCSLPKCWKKELYGMTGKFPDPFCLLPRALLRYAHPSSMRRTVKYASFLMISRALHLNVFDQPVK